MARGKKSKKAEPAPVVVKKAGKKRSKKEFKYRTPIKRICKDANILMVNRDGLQIVEGAYREILRGLFNHTDAMMKNNKHRLTKDTARRVFIGYMDTLDAANETCAGALEHADTALKSLYPAE